MLIRVDENWANLQTVFHYWFSSHPLPVPLPIVLEVNWHQPALLVRLSTNHRLEAQQTALDRQTRLGVLSVCCRKKRKTKKIVKLLHSPIPNSVNLNKTFPYLIHSYGIQFKTLMGLVENGEEIKSLYFQNKIKCFNTWPCQIIVLIFMLSIFLCYKFFITVK